MDEYYQDYLDFFANRLSKLRMTKDVSAQEMSHAIGQSKGYIAQIERKHNLPSMAGFFKICEYLNITPKDFFDEVIEYPAMFLELLDNLKGLNEEQLTSINNIAKGLKKNN